MTTTEAAAKTNYPRLFNRLMYGGFVAISLYQLLFHKDVSDAMSNLGIALIFDPFDPGVTWANRPMYQRAWLVGHVIVVFVLLGVILLA
jgi:hypothetical protein